MTAICTVGRGDLSSRMGVKGLTLALLEKSCFRISASLASAMAAFSSSLVSSAKNFFRLGLMMDFFSASLATASDTDLAFKEAKKDCVDLGSVTTGFCNLCRILSNEETKGFRVVVEVELVEAVVAVVVEDVDVVLGAMG